MQQIKDKLKGIGLQEACKGIVKQINSPTIVLVVIVAEQSKAYYKANKDKIAEQKKAYRKLPRWKKLEKINKKYG